MKNTTKNGILVFAVLSAVLFCDMPAQSQNIIYDGNQIAETSIIRNYRDNIDITYITDGGCFNYIDRNTLSVRKIYVTEFAVEGFVIWSGDKPAQNCSYENRSWRNSHAYDRFRFIL